MSNLKGWEKAFIAGPGMVLVGLAALVLIGPGLWALAHGDSLTARTQAVEMTETDAVFKMGRKKIKCTRALWGESGLPTIHYDPVNPDRCRTAAVLKRPSLPEIGGLLWMVGFVFLGIGSTLYSLFRMLFGK